MDDSFACFAMAPYYVSMCVEVRIITDPDADVWEVRLPSQGKAPPGSKDEYNGSGLRLQKCRLR